MPADTNDIRNPSAARRCAVSKYSLLAEMLRSQRRQAAQIEALMADVSALRDRLDAAREAPGPKPSFALR